MLVTVAAATLAVCAVLIFTLVRPASPSRERVVKTTRGPATSDKAASSSPTEPVVEPTRRPTRRQPAADAALSPAPVERGPEVGTLRIEADVPGAQVFIDRQFIGTAPVTAQNVKPGTHQLNVSVQGFDGIARAIDVEPGPRDLMIRFREVRLDARLAVVHKHRMGSCTGQLLATTQGLRYETADKDDRFDVPLADLEAFQVDYQDKNLRIKLRNGKQYNFTDPDGITDRLLVFHRDVDKARQRLASGAQAVTN